MLGTNRNWSSGTNNSKKATSNGTVWAQCSLVNAKSSREYTGNKLCELCADEIFHVPASPDSHETLPCSQEKAKSQPVNISGAIVDFASLKVFLKEKGVVMSVYNCPKCGKMVDVPENGQILICKYCGNPIKPTEIAEKIKSLI